jgi:hypothetical protein
LHGRQGSPILLIVFKVEEALLEIAAAVDAAASVARIAFSPWQGLPFATSCSSCACHPSFPLGFLHPQTGNAIEGSLQTVPHRCP